MLKAHVDMYTQNQERSEGYPSRQTDFNFLLEDFYEDESSETYSAYLGAEIIPINPTWFEELDTKLYWRFSKVTEDTNSLLWRVDHNDVIDRRRELDHKTFTDETLGYRADFRYSISGEQNTHNLAYGIDFSTDYYERGSDETIIDSRGVIPKDKQPFAPAREYNLGLYFRDLMELGKWTITMGLRFDAHNLTPDAQGEIGGFELKDIDSSELSPSLSVARENIHRQYHVHIL